MASGASRLRTSGRKKRESPFPGAAAAGLKPRASTQGFTTPGETIIGGLSRSSGTRRNHAECRTPAARLPRYCPRRTETAASLLPSARAGGRAAAGSHVRREKGDQPQLEQLSGAHQPPQTAAGCQRGHPQVWSGSGSGAHHRRDHAHPHGPRTANRTLQEHGGVRGVPVRIYGQCRDGRGYPGERRPDHLRRAEPRLDHRRLPAVESRDSRVQAQGHGGLRKNLRGNQGLARTKAADHRRGVQHGWRHRPAAGAVRSGGKVQLHHDGGRRARLGRAGPQRARNHRSPEMPRARGHPGGHAEQSHRGHGRLRVRLARPGRISLPPRPAVLVLHFASAFSHGDVPGGVLPAGFADGRGTDRQALGEYALFSEGAVAAGISAERERDADFADSGGRRGEGV